MRQLTLKRKSFTKLCSFCTTELIDYVFNAFQRFGGIIIIDEKNEVDDIWELENFHNESECDKLEIMKVMSVFCENGGIFIIEDKKMFFEGIVLLENGKEGTMVNKMWLHCKLNEMIPSFDLGKLEIPPIKPRFTYIKISEYAYRVEKWLEGKYVPTSLFYPTKEIAEAKVKELNDETM